jgi:hypothetical protein
MQTNHLSHFVLALGLLPALQRGTQQPPKQSSSSSNAPAGPEAAFRSRIVSVASDMHHFGYNFGPEDPLQKKSYSTTLAYGNSKLAQVRPNSAGHSYPLMALTLLHRAPDRLACAAGSIAGVRFSGIPKSHTYFSADPTVLVLLCGAHAVPRLQILFTAELSWRLAAAGTPVDVLCLHPGNVMTEVVRSLPPLIQTLYRALLTHVLFTPEEGECCWCYCCWCGQGLRCGLQCLTATWMSH